MIKVTIDGKEWILTNLQTTPTVIKTPSGKTVIQHEAVVWRYLEA